MNSGIRAVAVTLIGAAVLYALLDVVHAAQFGTFENSDPTLFARLWAVWSTSMFIVPGVLIALLSNRRVPLIGAIAYGVGFISNLWYHYDEGNVARDRWALFQTSIQHWPSSLASFLMIAAVGAVVGLIAVRLRSVTDGGLHNAVLLLLGIGGWLSVLALAAVTSIVVPNPGTGHSARFGFLYVTPAVSHLVHWYIPLALILGAAFRLRVWRKRNRDKWALKFWR
jgi:hypothetical protein